MEPKKKKLEITIFTEEDRKRDILNYERRLEEIEREWRKSIHVSDAELLKIFPEAKDVILRNLRMYEKEKRELMQSFRNQIRLVRKKLPPDFAWFADELVKWLSPISKRLLEVNRCLKRLERFSWYINPRKRKLRLLPFEYLRTIPIEDVVSPYLETARRIGSDKIICLCPVHSESNPSFYIYLSTNTFHCFGCQAHGDGIDFIQKIRGCSLKEAAEYLINMYYGKQK